MVNTTIGRQTTMDQFLRRLVIAPRKKQEDIIGAGLRVLEGREDNALLYSASQAARLLNFSRQTLWRLTKENKLQPVNIRGLKRYRRSDLIALIEGGGTDHDAQ